MDDVLLHVLHHLDILGKAGQVLGHTELDVGREAELEGGVLAVSYPPDHVQHLSDHLEDLVLPQHHPGGAEMPIVTARDTTDKAEVARHQVLEVVGEDDLIDAKHSVSGDLEPGDVVAVGDSSEGDVGCALGNAGGASGKIGRL